MSEWITSWLRKNLSDQQLDNLRSSLFDRWTWDTNDPIERQLFEALEEERKNRELPVLSSTLTLPEGQWIVVDDENGTITITPEDMNVAAQDMADTIDLMILETLTNEHIRTEDD